MDRQVNPSNSERETEEPAFHHLLESSFLLATGSGLLLAGSVAWNLKGLGILWAVPTFAAIVTHFLAWVALALAVFGFRRSGRSSKQSVRKMTGAYFGSIAGFGVALALLPLLFPNGGGWYGSQVEVILGYGFFAYLPSVYAPVVIAHAALFRFSTDQMEDGLAVQRVVIGGWILVFVASVAVLAQAAIHALAVPQGGIAISWLAGLTSLGYAAIVLGLLREKGLRFHATMDVETPTR